MIFPGIKIKVCYENYIGETEDLEQKVNELEDREVTFYEVAGCGAFLDEHDDDKAYGLLYANGTSYLTKITPEELEEKINSHIRNNTLSIFAKGKN